MLGTSGKLTISERATGRVVMTSGQQSNCLPPYQLVLQPNGLLTLQDRRGSVLWAGGSACGGNSSCYSYALQNDGQLVVRDGDGAQIWSSLSAGQLSQLVSSGRPNISCIHSGPSPAATSLPSMSQQYQLLVSQQAAQLRLLDTASGSQVWTPQGALQGQAPAKLCIGSNGGLTLFSGTSTQALWSSDAGAVSNGPFAGLVTDDGCLEVRDGTCKLLWSSHQGSTNAGKRRSGDSGSGPAPRATAGSPPPSTASSRLQAPAPGGSTLQPPSMAIGSRRPPPLAGRSSSNQPREPAARLVQAPGRKPPPAACSLQLHQLCGGISLCGADAACPHMGCCSAQLACHRQSEYLWACS